VFGIDIETCPACGGALRIIACIEDPNIIEKILTHLDAKGAEPKLPGGRQADAVRWSMGRPNAGVDGCDQAIQLAEKAVHTAYAHG
jgi:hypothetical protein